MTQSTQVGQHWWQSRVVVYSLPFPHVVRHQVIRGRSG